MSNKYQDQLLPDGWKDDLIELGFEQCRGSQSYIYGNIVFAADSNWPSLKTHWTLKKDCLSDQMGKPGLWKFVEDGDGHCLTFEFNTSAIGKSERTLNGNFNKDVSPFREMVQWGLNSLDSEQLCDWFPPPRGEIEDLIPSGALTAHRGAYARQGEMIYETDRRLAFRYIIAKNLPNDLSRKRKLILERSLIKTQSRWRLVRVGIVKDQSGELSVQAEIDLTGTPRTVLGNLVEIVLCSLKEAVEWILEPIILLVDSQIKYEALDS